MMGRTLSRERVALPDSQPEFLGLQPLYDPLRADRALCGGAAPYTSGAATQSGQVRSAGFLFAEDSGG
jgi:hypothetical protein